MALGRIVFALVATSLGLGSWLDARAAELSGVRFGGDGRSATRIVIDLTGAAEYTISTDGGGEGRVILTLDGVSVKAGAGTGEGLVRLYEIKDQSKSSQLVFDLAAPAAIKAHFPIAPSAESKHFRVVVDLERERAQTAAKGPVPASEPAAGAVAQYEDLTPMLKELTPPEIAIVRAEDAAAKAAALPIIVIDPGHGGSDPGASSAAGSNEKTATLAAAKALSDILQARGRYQIVLTRADDTRLALDERAQIARDAKPDLFISLHADAHPDASVRGASVYTLSQDGTERSAREARSSGDYHDVYALDLTKFSPDLGGILYSKAQSTTASESDKFANFLLKRLTPVTPLVNNSHRAADLKVLLAPDVPAILFELAFISNASDAANLGSVTWRTKTMGAVADAIDDYFGAHKEARRAAPASSGS
jgi:N-acetylmuramoyl-L-alanine amidase